MNKNLTIAVGLSGGVDSSLTAVLLKEQGYNLIGLTMEIWDGSVDIKEGPKHACYGPGEDEDIELADNLCKKLEIPYHVIDLKKEYNEWVIQYFKKEYLAGRTPNPCVVCNQKVKFGFLIEKARELGIQFDRFATGHYARLDKINNLTVMKRAVQVEKDQTYFIYGLKRDLMDNLIFPLGGYSKEQVRSLARKYGLETADRPESQDFISGGDYSPLFTNDKIDSGDIVDETGKVLGEHKGIIHYTIGQRKGLGLTSPEPLYVLKIDAKKNQVIVGKKNHLFSDGMILSDINWIAPFDYSDSLEVEVKIRRKHQETPAKLERIDENNIKVIFEDPQMSVTPGQAAVFYQKDLVLGGGIIQRSI